MMGRGQGDLDLCSGLLGNAAWNIWAHRLVPSVCRSTSKKNPNRDQEQDAEVFVLVHVCMRVCMHVLHVCMHV
jgi:hypothetical protein